MPFYVCFAFAWTLDALLMPPPPTGPPPTEPATQATLAQLLLQFTQLLALLYEVCPVLRMAGQDRLRRQESEISPNCVWDVLRNLECAMRRGIEPDPLEIAKHDADNLLALDAGRHWVVGP